MRPSILAVAAALSLSAPVRAEDMPAAPLNLHLVCDGDLTTVQREKTEVTVSKDNDATDSASGESVTRRTVHRRARIEMDVAGQAVRLHPGAGFTSEMGPKATGAWYDLTDVVIDKDQIAGRFRLNFAVKPTVRVDRHSGEVALRGLVGLFDGVCEKSTQPVDAQKF